MLNYGNLDHNFRMEILYGMEVYDFIIIFKLFFFFHFLKKLKNFFYKKNLKIKLFIFKKIFFDKLKKIL
jgi:hypothetical protein